MYNESDYEGVAVRLPRAHADHEDLRVIVTLLEVVRDDNKRPLQYICQAQIWCGDVLKAQDVAEEIVGSSYVNKTSALENCATSAIGRALANMGYQGSVNGKPVRPSLEEMQKVQRAEKPVVRHQAEIDNWEQILNSKPEGITTLAEGVELVTKDLGASAIPAECKHGKMLRKTGSNTKGSYSGWVCPHPIREEQCKPIWAK